MKKLKDKLLDIITDDNFLEALWYIVYVLWFGFVGRMIIISDLHIIVRILMLLGDLWWALYIFAQHHYNSDKE
jgi:hypothetical protein